MEPVQFAEARDLQALMEPVWLASARAASVVGVTAARSNPVCVKTWPSIVETAV